MNNDCNIVENLYYIGNGISDVIPYHILLLDELLDKERKIVCSKIGRVLWKPAESG